MAPRPEYAWVRYARCDDRGNQLADARYFTERLAHLTARVGFGDLLLQIFNPPVERLDLPAQNLYRHDGWFGSVASASASSRSSSTRPMPLATTMPNSARWLRTAFTLIVRCLTSSSRVLCSISVACCSAVFIGTKRMPGRDTASQIASAST